MVAEPSAAMSVIYWVRQAALLILRKLELYTEICWVAHAKGLFPLFLSNLA